MRGEMKMTDLYTKIVLTVIAVAACISVFQNMHRVPAYPEGDIQKVQICDKYGECAFIENLALRVTND